MKDIQWRAVDVNRPVTRSCALDAALAARLRAVTGGLTSTARLRSRLLRFRPVRPGPPARDEIPGILPRGPIGL
ncbi:MAG UNVERIFIED_CONTAM: hypothetical protein LVR18_05320 [Planctomycetaceae bacterium]